ncbi:SatD family protein [Micrococcus sp.]|uniref:SatD family protein n=1 Tax=Micrococcus sp. TaxID=1271 RepID=UPI002A916213|nr:SatD family protein [Micrococcus sp.]MDY6054445.1 SatD family protein [Micrococcus sp.]
MSAAETPRVTAVIADLVGSRTLPDRAGAHEQVLTAWSRAHTQVLGPDTASTPPWATVGDEFQAVYPDLPTALRALLRLMLSLEDPVRLRFGLGLGTVTTLDHGEAGPIQDGDAWWAARAAIEAGRDRDRHGAVLEIRAAQGAAVPADRDGMDTGGVGAAGIGSAAARLLEHIVAQMRPRARRILRAALDGTVQTEIADAEGISQSAVSQSLTRSGGRALLDVDHLLTAPTTEGEPA